MKGISYFCSDPGYDKTTSTTARACVSRAVKKHNGHIPRERLVIDYAAAAMEQMQLYCAAHPGSPSAVRRPQLFFAVTFGSPYLGQAWKKGSPGSGLLSRQLCARSTPNIWLACVRRSKALARPPRSKLMPQRGVPTAALNPAENFAEKFLGHLVFPSATQGVILAQPLFRRNSKISTGTD